MNKKIKKILVWSGSLLAIFAVGGGITLGITTAVNNHKVTKALIKQSGFSKDKVLIDKSNSTSADLALNYVFSLNGKPTANVNYYFLDPSTSSSTTTTTTSPSSLYYLKNNKLTCQVTFSHGTFTGKGTARQQTSKYLDTLISNQKVTIDSKKTEIPLRVTKNSDKVGKKQPTIQAYTILIHRGKNYATLTARVLNGGGVFIATQCPTKQEVVNVRNIILYGNADMKKPDATKGLAVLVKSYTKK